MLHLLPIYIFYEGSEGKPSFVLAVSLFVKVYVCVWVCVFHYCLTSNTAQIKAQNKSCENKSPTAVTHDHAQDTDGVCGGGKKTASAAQP